MVELLVNYSTTNDVYLINFLWETLFFMWENYRGKTEENCDGRKKS